MAKPTFYEGQKAVNDQTGQTLVYNKGRWAPEGAGSVSSVMQDTPVDQKFLVEQREKSQQYIDAASKAQEFAKINQTQGTGGILAVPFVPGIQASGNEDVARMMSITSELGPKKRPPGSGSSSDKDTTLYLRSVPNVDFPGNANVKIANSIQTDSNKQSAYTAFMDTWMSKRGSLLGAEQAFNGWWSREGASKYDMNNRPVSPRPVSRAAAPKGAPKPSGKYEVLSVEED